VVILDLELSGELVTAQIPGLVAAGYRVVAFSGHSDPAIVMETLDNGAHAYVSKDEGRDHLVEAVLAAAADRPYVTRSQARAMLADQRPARPALSEQERQALLLWFQGMSKASVGRRMSISENTVRQYISRARAKYAATGRTAPSKDALLARAIEDGVIKPGEITPYESFAAPRPTAPARVPPASEWPGTPKAPPGAAPGESAAGRHWAAGRAPRHHQIVGWCTVSIPGRGGTVMTPDRVTPRHAGKPAPPALRGGAPARGGCGRWPGEMTSVEQRSRHGQVVHRSWRRQIFLGPGRADRLSVHESTARAPGTVVAH
jgi:DNA-binding NarL/FixJ family response regulator